MNTKLLKKEFFNAKQAEMNRKQSTVGCFAGDRIILEVESLTWECKFNSTLFEGPHNAQIDGLLGIKSSSINTRINIINELKIQTRISKFCKVTTIKLSIINSVDN